LASLELSRDLMPLGVALCRLHRVAKQCKLLSSAPLRCFSLPSLCLRPLIQDRFLLASPHTLPQPHAHRVGPKSLLRWVRLLTTHAVETAGQHSFSDALEARRHVVRAFCSFKAWLIAGRLVVSVSDASVNGLTLHDALSDREDRIHFHNFTVFVDIPSKDIAADDCCNTDGAQNGQYVPFFFVLCLPLADLSTT
jgi:hypothetical protein